MNFKTFTKVSIGATIVLILLFLFSLTKTFCATFEPSTITKLRMLNSTYYMIDSASNSLLVGTKSEIENGNFHSISNRYEGNTGIPFNNLKDVTILQNRHIFLIDGIADGIFEYDENLNFTSDHNRFENGSSITDVIALTSDFNDNIFALQVDEGLKVLKKSSDDDYFDIFTELSVTQLANVGLTNFENAVISCDFENQTLFIASDGILLKVTNQDFDVLATFSGLATDIAVDYLGYPYVALDSGKILKMQEESFFLELSTISFHLNFENGDINYVDSTGLKSFSGNFVNNLSNFQHPLDFKIKENLSQSVEILQLTQNANIYKYPFKVAKLEEISANTKVIKLADCANHPDFVYVLLTKDNELSAFYIESEFCGKLNPIEINQQMRTFTQSAKLFKYPTADTINEESLCLTKVPNYTNLLIKNDVCQIEDSQGRTFYEVIFQDKIYYVLTSMVTTLATEEGAVTLKASNATLKSKDPINVYASSKSDTIVAIMNPNTHFYVNIKTFDNNSKRTYVEFLDENNHYVSGFVDTKQIKLKEMSPFIIVGILLILVVAILILILVLYFAKEKKLKKATQNED